MVLCTLAWQEVFRKYGVLLCSTVLSTAANLLACYIHPLLNKIKQMFLINYTYYNIGMYNRGHANRKPFGGQCGIKIIQNAEFCSILPGKKPQHNLSYMGLRFLSICPKRLCIDAAWLALVFYIEDSISNWIVKFFSSHILMSCRAFICKWKYLSVSSLREKKEIKKQTGGALLWAVNNEVPSSNDQI